MAFGGTTGYPSCTPAGIIRLLDHCEVQLEGADAVMIGRPPILGKPVGMLLLQRNATVTHCHSRTKDLAEHVRGAEVVVAAAGIPSLVRGAWLKPGCVVIDAGYNEGNIGDVAFEGRVRSLSLVVRQGGTSWDLRIYPDRDLGFVVMTNTTRAWDHHMLFEAIADSPTTAQPT